MCLDAIHPPPGRWAKVFLRLSTPVSYTHLDVYKRQAKCRGQITHPNAHFIDDIRPLGKWMFPLA